MIKIHNLIVKDAFRQIFGRFISAVLGIVVVMMLSQYLGPYRFGDYSNILDIFAIRGALADFGLYTLTLRTLGPLKEAGKTEELQRVYSKFLFTRLVSICVVYGVVLLIAYQIPAYTANPYLVWGLPIGMLFSAVFMAASMVQLPLQLFRQMKKVTIALTLARIAQLIVLVVLLYGFVPGQGGDGMPVWIFVAVVGSVLISGLAQLRYTFSQTKKYLQIKLLPDWKFTWSITKSNAAYGLAYFLSSMHTLAISVVIGVVFPTIAGFPEQGIWKLALGIVVVLIIIPSSIGNSMIHKIAGISRNGQRTAIGHLMNLMIVVGFLIVTATVAFSPQIIGLVGGPAYLSSDGVIGSDFLLPWLAVVLFGSFIKQSFNYLFLAIKKQNVLLSINGIGILIGLPFALFAIRERGLLGALWGQGVLELLFVVGSLLAASHYKALPLMHTKNLLRFVFLGLVCVGAAFAIHVLWPLHAWYWSIPLGLGLLGIFFVGGKNSIKDTLRGLG